MKRNIVLTVLLIVTFLAGAFAQTKTKNLFGEGWRVEMLSPDRFLLYYSDATAREKGFARICGKGYQCGVQDDVIHIEEIRRFNKKALNGN